MTIFVGSRYANQPVLRVKGSDGITRPTVYRAPQQQAQRFLHYQVVFGDRFDLLAYRYYGDPTLWWLIADANPEVFYPDLVTGSVIRIPQS